MGAACSLDLLSVLESADQRSGLQMAANAHFLAVRYQLSSGGGAEIYQKPAGGNGQEELLLRSGLNGYPDDWSPDGEVDCV